MSFRKHKIVLFRSYCEGSKICTLGALERPHCDVMAWSLLSNAPSLSTHPSSRRFCLKWNDSPPSFRKILSLRAKASMLEIGEDPCSGTYINARASDVILYLLKSTARTNFPGHVFKIVPFCIITKQANQHMTATQKCFPQGERKGVLAS